MIVLSKRGVKRRCQNDQCGLPFYDLNREPIACPNCSSAFVVPVLAPVTARTQWRTGGRSAPAWRPELPVEQPTELAEDIAVEDADEDVVEPTTETEILLESDADEAIVPIEPTSERTVDE